MTYGYHLASNNLVQTTIDDPSTRPNLVFPIIFCYRHSLELALKYIIAGSGPRAGVAPNWRSHDLAELWSTYLDICEALDARADDGDSVVANCVAEFAKIDVASFSFRYPTDRNGNDIPLGIDALNLAQLRDVMDGVSAYLDGAAEYLDHLASSKAGS